MKQQVEGFTTFIREQGVMGLAIGFILGGAVSGLVQSLVRDIINPLIAFFFSGAETLSQITLGPVLIGSFVSVLLNFLIIASVAYFIFKGLRLDRLDRSTDR